MSFKKKKRLYIIASGPKECTCVFQAVLPFRIFASMEQILSSSPLAEIGRKMLFRGMHALLILGIVILAYCAKIEIFLRKGLQIVTFAGFPVVEIWLWASPICHSL